MVRRSAVPDAPVSSWEAAQEWARLLTYRQVLAYETEGWPPGTAIIRRAFWWTREDVPAEFHRDYAPDRPDPRVVLGAGPEVLARHAEAVAAWKERDAEWRAARLAWLREAAAGG